MWICFIMERAMAVCVQAPLFLSTWKNLCSISSSWARAMTFAVPLCILNVDIPAHFSDDLGVFIHSDGVLGSSSPHWGRGCGYTDDTVLLTLLVRVLVRMCTCAFCVNILSAYSHGLKAECSAAPLRVHFSSYDPVSHPHLPQSACTAGIRIN